MLCRAWCVCERVEVAARPRYVNTAQTQTTRAGFWQRTVAGCRTRLPTQPRHMPHAGVVLPARPHRPLNLLCLWPHLLRDIPRRPEPPGRPIRRRGTAVPGSVHLQDELRLGIHLRLCARAHGADGAHAQLQRLPCRGEVFPRGADVAVVQPHVCRLDVVRSGEGCGEGAAVGGRRGVCGEQWLQRRDGRGGEGFRCDGEEMEECTLQ